MNRYLVAMAVVALSTIYTEAGPFGLVSRKGGNTNTQSNNSGGQVYHDNGELWSAQGVANRIARTGIFRHWGNPSGGYEGIGIGGNAYAAEMNCCYRRQWAPREIGIAIMPNGMYVACCRY
jgi:hypothetical protein